MAFLDNADQHQQPDHGNEAQVHAEQSQRQERPYDGGGQAGQDCEGVNIAFLGTSLPEALRIRTSGRIAGVQLALSVNSIITLKVSPVL